MEVSPIGTSTVVDVQFSGVSWPAITAGAVATAALSLLLLAFGAGIGLSSVSPWAGSGVSATTFKVGSGIYLVIVAVMASSIGGYLAARLRTKWTGLHTNEVYFRDTAHGLLAVTGSSPIAQLIADGLVIFGWVANWRPAEIFLYDFWEIRRTRRLYLSLAHADIALVTRKEEHPNT